MSLGVSKDCFPDASKCHNCEGKRTGAVKKHADPKQNFKRCSNCHLMTYCDAVCQREHWLNVHKKHCRFLSGKTPVKNSKHDAATCVQCIHDRETTHSQIKSKNSPKTFNCKIELINECMLKALGSAFGFHEQGKKCNSSLEHGLQLPFALGEVSGQYLEIAGTGLDPMLAHASNIVSAMYHKAQDYDALSELSRNTGRTVLSKLFKDIIRYRAVLWYDVLVGLKPVPRDLQVLSDQVESLRNIYGTTDPWWKVLNFSVELIFNTRVFLASNFYDYNSLDDPRFPNLKQMFDHDQSKLHNQAMVCEMNMWTKFMLWPQLVNDSLVVLLPPGICCQICSAQLSGEVATSTHEAKVVFCTFPNLNVLPWLLPHVGENGEFEALCPPVQKPTCRVDYLKGVYRLNREERDLFSIESRECDSCLKSSLSSHRCSACLSVQYCSLVCQKKDLGFHKTVCATWAKDDSKTLLGKGKQKKYWKKTVAEKSEMR